MCLFSKLTVHLDRHTKKSKCGVLVYIVGHFTDYFGITEVRGKNSAYNNLERLHHRGTIHSKNNTFGYLIIAIIIKLLMYVNP